MTTVTEKKQKMPKLRFPGFDDFWKTAQMSELLERVGDPVDTQPQSEYREIGIRSHGKGVFHKAFVTGMELGEKRVFHVVPGALAFNIVFAWEQAVATLTIEEEGFIASHRFPMYLPKAGNADVEFIREFFLRPRGKYLLELASPGGAGRNKTLGQAEFLRLKITVPEAGEQQKIAAFLDAVDNKIAQLQKKKALLEDYKKGCMQKLLSRTLRFKDDNGNAFPDWETHELGDLLDYEQPTKYLVKNTEYSDDFTTPVLTAGKTFILGKTNEVEGVYRDRLPAIIFDDFTTASQFVDFPFKAKSSAMKILTSKNQKNEIRLIFEMLKAIKYEPGDHKRHWISEFQYFNIELPHPDEQKKISGFLSAIDSKIQLVTTEIDQAQTFKKGLLQQMFV